MTSILSYFILGLLLPTIPTTISVINIIDPDQLNALWELILSPDYYPDQEFYLEMHEPALNDLLLFLPSSSSSSSLDLEWSLWFDGLLATIETINKAAAVVVSINK